jgi:type VI secretion system protein ImpF
MQRVVSHQKYRRGVVRDLTWLFNTSAFLPPEAAGSLRLKDYPDAWASVINYGTRQLCGLASPNLEQMQEELSEAVRFFEPRIMARSLSIHANVERNTLVFEVEGDLWANPVPEHLHVRTTVDLETGESLLKES